jgi:hypothetical protein
MNMNNETRLTGWLQALGERDRREAPAVNSAWTPTPNCPPLPRFLAALQRQDWTAKELSHTKECVYCRKMEAKVRQSIAVQSPSIPANEVRPLTISFQELVVFAKSVEGQILQTLHRHREFRVVVTETSLVYIPTATGKRTKDDSECIRRICEEFSRTNQYSPSHYRNTLKAWHASYTLTLIRKYLDKTTKK